MNKIDKIWHKYENQNLLKSLESLDDVNRLALTFGKAVEHTYRLITLRRDRSLYPSGYDDDEAPIVGLLTRVAKLFGIVCKFYDTDNGDYLALFSRPLIESAIIATYLLRNGDEAVEDFRLCSYKDTLRMLHDHESMPELFQMPIAQQNLHSAREALAIEGLSEADFAVQEKNHWHLQGKSFYRIFSETASSTEYPLVWGMMPDFLHGSWGSSTEWCLSRNNDDTFSPLPSYSGIDARQILTLVRFATPPYFLWSERTLILDDSMRQAFDSIRNHCHMIHHKLENFQNGQSVAGNSVSPNPRQAQPIPVRIQPNSRSVNKIQDILAKYDQSCLKRLFASTSKADRLALTFYEDIGEIFEAISLMKNVERNPTGFSVDDAPILGLLVNTWKLLKLLIWIYRKEDNAEHAHITERSLIEVTVTANYLLLSDQWTMKDYRRCSYKNQIQIVGQAAGDSAYYGSKEGHRLLQSISRKLALEGLDEHGFAEQILNNWCIAGKPFHRIFREAIDEEFYPMTYGMWSSAVHNSWKEVRRFSLRENAKSYCFLPAYEPGRMDIARVSGVIPLALPSFLGWSARVQLDKPFIEGVLDFIDKINTDLFDKYTARINSPKR